jgi:hypothetical protein
MKMPTRVSTWESVPAVGLGQFVTEGQFVVVDQGGVHQALLTES